MKSPFTVGYVGVNSVPLSTAGCYRLADDGSPLFDVAIVFAANLNMSPPAGYVALDPNAPDGHPMVTANPQTVTALQSGDVAKLESQGVRVLLSVLGNHDAAGWSNFADDAAGQADAEAFAGQLAYVAEQYGFDGIDIDDEYSDPDLAIPTSLAMVTWYMRQAMPGAIISKALYQDAGYFGATWTTPDEQQATLAGNLDYGWEMSYWLSGCSELEATLEPYAAAGVSPHSLAAGVSLGQTSASDAATLAGCVTSAAYGGMMIFDLELGAADYLTGVSAALYGQPTVQDPAC